MRQSAPCTLDQFPEMPRCQHTTGPLQVDGRQQCLGVDVLDTAATAMTRFLAPVTLLATGGAGQVFPATTNPSVVTGDGIAMAARAQARLQDLEFIQFHPTGFAGQMPNTSAEDSQTFLISEAVRGEGGRLYNKLGHRWGICTCKTDDSRSALGRD